MTTAVSKAALLRASLLGRDRLDARIGSAEAGYALERSLNRLARCADSHGAESVDMQPDGLQARFATPEAALLAARDMLERVAALLPMKGEKLAFCACAVLCEEDAQTDPPGLAEALLPTADAGRIVASMRFGDVVAPVLRRRLVPLPAAEGVPPVLLLRDTSPPGAAELRRVREPRRVLEVAHRGRSWQVDEARPVLLVGRDPSCDVVLDHAQVSRWHARIEWFDGGFQVIDTSTNGTRLSQDGGEEVTLRRGACRLGDTRRSSHGQLAIGTFPEAVTFRLSGNEAGIGRMPGGFRPTQ